jgi:hypothetical protein
MGCRSNENEINNAATELAILLMLYLFSLYLLIPQSVSNTVWDPYHEAFQSDVIMIFYTVYI